jgi:RNA polymerase sigma-70 factor (ECF subfamily)
LRVATNLALQHLRRRAAPVGAATRFDEARLGDLRGPGASDPGRRFAERDLVRETLLELTPKARALLVLREVYGLSAEEVGDALKMSREAVKVGLWRARAQFRDHYTRKEAQS